MIGFLSGKISYKDAPYLLIDVHGVGYKVLASAALFEKPIGDVVTIFTHTHVKEDALDLYGFATQNDLKVFEMLIGISGIGPKTAIGIFGLGTAEEIVGAIGKADVDFFTGVPRLGRKNAQKIIIELKNKIGSVSELNLAEEMDSTNGEVVGALMSIGFSDREAWAAVRALNGKGETVQEKVKMALKSLGK